ncbi:class I SAM-dependent methyltransferase [Cellulosimicrobium cellulans]|uniref:Methyltransferase n=1 Tax=Cellulosimicrobium cellulans TaxID=1710 RepID=A0A4Y4E7Z2_CELCE|nr:class I SAM-dependent methyltransferase [Cellulosimicrobium cellulans]GED10751.1 methyltransferase [Cellulosimicrobium cellulans]
MSGWDSQTYGRRWSSIYDGLPWPEPTETVDFLMDWTGAGRVLELAIGTGRVAIPLAARGVEVEGLDTSQEMIDVLRSKPGGENLTVHQGDIGRFALDRTYSMAFLILNTIYALQSQEEQISCFESTAAVVEPGGHFVVEAFMPDPTRFRRNSWTQVHDIGLEHVVIEADKHDPSTQQILEQHIHIRDGKIELFPAFLRYIWPSEMDLMARLAGFTLVERFGSWTREKFSARSGQYVSVYRRA